MKIKICCISSIEEAKAAIDHGADALGLVSSMPDGPGVISDEKIKEIRNVVPDQIDVFLLTSKFEPQDLIDQVNDINPTHLQLVDYIPIETIHLIKFQFPQLHIVQVLHVSDESIFDLKNLYEAVSDSFLLDSGRPFSLNKSLGGTGQTHDWSISRRIVDSSLIPVFLAGGINADNVLTAIEKVSPFGIDLCSGVRTDNHLDLNKLNQFMNRVKSYE